MRKAAVIPFNENKESASQETNGPPLKRKRPLSLQRRLLNRLNPDIIVILSADKSKNSLKPVKKVTTFKLLEPCVASLRPG